jgi:NADH-quinone oxidoreductase subunit N
MALPLLAQAQPQGPGDLTFPPVVYSALSPFLVFVGAALLLLLLSSLGRGRVRTGVYATFTLLASALATAGVFVLWDRVAEVGAHTVVAGAVVVDGFALFLTLVIIAATALGGMLADPYLKREGIEGPEMHVLMLLSAAGGILMASANDLIVLFLGLEILSISLYVMAGMHGRRAESREAAMKYFVLGAFSSALFLYGIALVYGATGSTNLPEITTFLVESVIVSRGLLLAGLALLLVGFGFKVAAVPFHSWTPDVYQGAPTPVTGFMAAAAKAAGFAGLLRVFFATFGTMRLDWQPVVAVLAIVTLLAGSVLAIVQTDIKRMLAYSSISHAGYVLIGLQAASAQGIAGSLFYLFAYTFMVLGSFAIVTVVAGRGDSDHALDSYKGLSARRPALALAFAVLLMAQAGVPFTSGFLGKLYVIKAAVDSGSYALALIGMLAAVIAAFVYLRVIVLMFMAPADEAAPRLPIPLAVGAVVVVAAAVTVITGVLPAPLIEFARDATLLL